MRLTAKSCSLLTGLLLAASLTSPAVADTITSLTPRVPMPAFKIPGISGTSGSDADLRNKVTIIRFWASW